jgi:hypothetical protein
MKSKQQGSAHIIIVVILVLALLGALGFIFWQNFLNAKPEVTKVQTTVESTTTTLKTGYAIDNWGVTIPVAGTGYEENTSPANNPEHFSVTTKAILAEAQKDNCTDITDDVSLGQIQKETSVDAGDPTPHSAVIGGYYYFFLSRSEVACADSNGNGPTTLNNLEDAAIKDLTSAIVNTTAS